MGLMEDIKREIERAQQQQAQAQQPTGMPVGAPPAGRRTVILCCMDPRLRPEAALGIPSGAAVVLRNAGGTGGDEVFYSLKAACDVFGARDFVVMGHADCAFAYDGGGQWDAGGARAAMAQADRIRAWGGLPADATVRAVVVRNLQQNRAVPAEAALNPEPEATPSSTPGRGPGVPQGKSSAETNRVGGRLEREQLIRVPPAPPMMPPTLSWEQRNPTAADFQRKVAEMTRSEAQPLHALPDGSTLDAPGALGAAAATADAGGRGDGGADLLDHLDARALIRSIAIGEVLDEPRGRRNARRPHPT